MPILVEFYRLDREARALPRLEAAAQYVNFAKAVLFEHPRHTGAGFFMTSRTVGNDRPMPVDMLYALIELFDRQVNGAWYSGWIPAQGSAAACINEGRIFHAFANGLQVNAPNSKAPLAMRITLHDVSPTGRLPTRERPRPQYSVKCIPSARQAQPSITLHGESFIHMMATLDR